MHDATATPTETQPQPEALRPLVHHTQRQQWGRALMVWENGDKRGYQFEDGELRVFTSAYYKFLEPEAKPDPLLRHQLREQAAASGALPEAGQAQGSGRSRKAAGPMPTLDDQITVFRDLYPEGFLGARWTSATRLRLQARPLKCHREPAIALAAERLSSEALQACIDDGRYDEVLERVVEVVKATDLATTQQLSMFTGITADAELAESLHAYLHDLRQGELLTMARLRRALARHNVRKLAWPALTAPRALLHPNDHLCVHPSVVRAQAKLLMPRYTPATTPSAEDYARALELVVVLRERLQEAELSPRDLFDVTGFMKVTLSSSVKAQLTEAMVNRRTVEAGHGPAAEEAAAAQEAKATQDAAQDDDDDDDTDDDASAEDADDSEA